jgi:hypothetical protein
MFFKDTWSDIIGTEMIVGPDAENGGMKMPALKANFRSQGNRNDKKTTCFGEGHPEGEVTMFAWIVTGASDFSRSVWSLS